tara:strand:- start:17390 stop:17587 length:198 start_codon:yes stop_codon:yes gene_type:complete
MAYNAPTIIEGPVKISKIPSMTKHNPSDPSDIEHTKIPGLLRSLRSMAPKNDNGREIMAKIIGKM